MSGERKPTPLAEAFALIDAMMGVGTAEADKSRAAIQRSIECFIRGDLKGCDAELDSADAYQAAAIAATAKAKPSAKRASAAGKKSGEARRIKGNHEQLLARYKQLLARGHPKPVARAKLLQEVGPNRRSQVDRILAKMKNSSA